jgi:hypothetical protein
MVNVKLSLCFNWAPRHEGVLGESRYSSTHTLTSAPDGGEWSALRPGRFTPRGRGPGTHWIGGWVGPRAVLDAVVKMKIPSPRRESNPRWCLIKYIIIKLWSQSTSHDQCRWYRSDGSSLPFHKKQITNEPFCKKRKIVLCLKFHKVHRIPFTQFREYSHSFQEGLRGE